jgi:hypothetical protein
MFIEIYHRQKYLDLAYKVTHLEYCVFKGMVGPKIGNPPGHAVDFVEQ